ncbi:hypothetical protein D0T53_07405 [Dysgonomonas sp. 216]|uniref:TlpA family protein disulfide reductase n=1 Tax=Dysgonomonas sp. 216 TaxID=2302934 RepID=UPI0013D77455|nr:hypothetical protein [Dysgonomonas sp. 216]NDW18739.1 hypothetical protein [Dysgonomonas sp. 216]
MRKIIMLFKILLLLLLLPCFVKAQTLEVELPYCSGREYSLCLLQGTGQDTIAMGVLDDKGKAIISFPLNYRGVGRLTIQQCGHMRNIILNGEKRITLSQADSLEAKTIFTHSPENSFLIEAMAKQSRILNDYYHLANGQTEQFMVFASPEQRMKAVENEYKAFRGEISGSPLYAARVLEILNLLTGVGSSFIISEQQMLEEQRGFIVNKVNFNDLYTSGFWSQTLEAWVQMTSQNDTLLLANARHMLDRCGGDIPIRRELTQAIIRLFSKYAKDSLLAELGTEYLTMPLNGQLAPEIVAPDGTSFIPKSSLIVFYETGCGNCHYELENLKAKYSLLSNEHNGLRVISIAADTGKEVHEETSAKLPWADKFCDFKGFDGDNFRNYGIVGTPTYILTDKEGIVRGRYAQLKELIKD